MAVGVAYDHNGKKARVSACLAAASASSLATVADLNNEKA